jgi:type I restriction enzyme M protein
VGLAEETGDGEPFGEKMTRLTGELSGLFAEGRKLEKEIRKRKAGGDRVGCLAE